MQPAEDNTPRPQSSVMPRRRRPLTALRIDTPAQNPAIALVLGESSASASTLSSATSESDYTLPFSNRPRSQRNMKKLSLTLPSAHSNLSTNSLTLPPESPAPHAADTAQIPSPPDMRRRPSIVSLPNASMSTFLHRKDEDDSPSAPYLDGPVQVLPGIWLGSEDNARDWKALFERGIKSILNVAKEVNSPFDSSASSQPLRPFASTPNLKKTAKESEGTFYPAHGPSGRPGLNYLKLPWSHGQTDLVHDGFVTAMAFVDSALDRGDGVLVHCQCGVSRSATIAIALVMRAAALSLPSVPPEVWALKSAGMHGAYAFVKDKSKWVGPNMSLIYQLLEYERYLGGSSKSPSASERSSAAAEEEEEWSRQRRLLDDAPSDAEVERDIIEVMKEARALDKAMEERMVARKTSNSSAGSSTGIGMGPAWKNRYGGRARTGSIASNLTMGSVLSEDLVEEDEEQELLGVGGGFDGQSIGTRSPSAETTEEEAQGMTTDVRSNRNTARFLPNTPLTARPDLTARRPSFLEVQSSFNIPPPSAPATKSSFNLPPRVPSKTKRRPPPLGLLPPVPSSPIVPVAQPVVSRPRTTSRRPAPPPLHLRNPNKLPPPIKRIPSTLNTPSQTLFVFPPSPTFSTQTPSTLTLMSGVDSTLPFPSIQTPRVATFKSHGRSRSFIGLRAPPTPTTACSRVDARGWVGLGAG